jgi:hypothetical protein
MNQSSEHGTRYSAAKNHDTIGNNEYGADIRMHLAPRGATRLAGVQFLVADNMTL